MGDTISGKVERWEQWDDAKEYFLKYFPEKKEYKKL